MIAVLIIVAVSGAGLFFLAVNLVGSALCWLLCLLLPKSR